MEEIEASGRLKVDFQRLMGANIIDDRTVAACRRGDPEAFRLVYESYKDRVYSIALVFFDGDEASAKEITQQSFLKVMTGISKFENRSQFSTWLYRLVTNACLDRKRALRRLTFLGNSVEAEATVKRTSIEETYIQRELESSVRTAIAGLKPRLRIAILLKYFEDLSYDEIASALGCSKGTVAFARETRLKPMPHRRLKSGSPTSAISLSIRIRRSVCSSRVPANTALLWIAERWKPGPGPLPDCSLWIRRRRRPSISGASTHWKLKTTAAACCMSRWGSWRWNETAARPLFRPERFAGRGPDRDLGRPSTKILPARYSRP